MQCLARKSRLIDWMVDIYVLCTIIFLFSVKWFNVPELLAITGSLVSFIAAFHLLIMQSVIYKGFSKIYRIELNLNLFPDWKKRKIMPKSFCAILINNLILIWQDSVLY